MDQSELKAIASLLAPERNNYFYGKLLDDAHLRMEQRYFNHKRWLLNRLVGGSGIACGLTVSEKNGLLGVTAGVAIDPLGREIIVPSDVTVDPWIGFDQTGSRTELAKDAAHTVWLCLSYVDCDDEFVPALVADCSGAGNVASSTLIETFEIRARTDTPPGLPTLPHDAVCQALRKPTAADRIRALCGAGMNDGCAPSQSACIALARIDLTNTGTIGSIDQCADRRVVYGNAALFEMILCLAQRVEECCGGTTTTTPAVVALSYVSGDNQSAVAGTSVPAPLVAEVRTNGAPTSGQQVTFSVKTGGGKISATTGGVPSAQAVVTTDASGKASLPVWQLGTASATNSVDAEISAGTPNRVTFRAAGTPPPPAATLRVANVELLNDRGTVVATVAGHPFDASVPADAKATAIRFTFTKAVDAKTLTTYTGSAASLQQATVLVLVVSSLHATASVQPVSTSPVAGKITFAAPDVAMFRLPKQGTPFPVGRYECVLMSSPLRPSIKAKDDGSLLDGEPVALPSGNAVPGGLFGFTFSIT